MSKSSYIRFSLRLWGEKLNPHIITNALGIKPSTSYEKGYTKNLSSGKTSAPKDLGIWVFEQVVVTSVKEELDSLLLKLGGRNMKSIEGVQIAILDFYLGLTNDNSRLDESYECVIDNNSLNALRELGVDFRITVA